MDEAFAAFEALCEDVGTRLESIETEQDARFQLIDRILVEVLGWSHEDLKTEPHGESGYTDYLLRASSAPAFVIEAKRTGKLLLDTVNPKTSTYKVGGPALASAAPGTWQAVMYCANFGVELAALTTGVVWIGFLSFPGGGRSYKDGKAVVFPSLEAIRADFATFYDLFGKGSVGDKVFKKIFARAEGLTAGHFDPLTPSLKQADAKLLPKSALAHDLEPIFRGFFSNMTGEKNRSMLVECFVETRESRNADASLERIVQQVTSEVDVLSTGTGSQLEGEIENVVASGLGENVIIVGNKGAGKSTFVERFFNVVLDQKIKDKCLIIYVDLLDHDGDLSSLGRWLVTRVKNLLRNQLYKDGISTYDELQGLYFREYQEWSTGQFKHLYDSDKNAFKIRFGEFLNSQINDDPMQFVLRMLTDIVSNRHLLPCLIFDNADHHNEGYQEAVFQWAQAVRREIDFSLVIIPITDRTIWRLSKAGPFQTYPSKTFYLPVPSTSEVLQKRITYLREKAEAGGASKSYFLNKGIRLSLNDIRAFAAAIEEIFVHEDYLSCRIGWLSNHDIRRGLLLSERVVTSPHLSIDDLVGAYLKREAQAPIKISHTKFNQALVLGDYDRYVGDDAEFVYNVFDVSPDFPSSPLLQLSILKLLVESAGAESSDSGYVGIDQAILYFGAMGVSEEASLDALQRLFDHRLIDAFDASISTLSADQKIGITHSGRLHYEFATDDIVYVSEMALVTEVRSTALVDRLRDYVKSRMRDEDWRDVRRAFVLYCLSQDRTFMRVPKETMYSGQAALRRDLTGRWAEKFGVAEDEDTIFGLQKSDQKPASHVEAKVIWFDPSKGFGFLDAGRNQDVFIHARVVERAGITSLNPGDTVVVDIAPRRSGELQAIAMHSVEPAPTAQDHRPLLSGVVRFFNANKGYGFLQVEGIDEDVYVSAAILNRSGIDALHDGEAIRAVVGEHVEGRGRAATQVQLASGEVVSAQ